MKFALITEGVSEHRIIKHIVSKYFKGHDPEVNQIQPRLLDDKQQVSGGWNEVLKYCEREELKDILIENDFLIIQIDTDQSQIAPFSISHSRADNTAKTSEELHDEVVGKLKGLIRPEIITQYGNRIFFAVCIHTIECWLLPIYYDNNHRTKVLNCLEKLNDCLDKKDIRRITPDNKNEANGMRSYAAVLSNWKRRQDIVDSAAHQWGLQKLVEAFAGIVVADR